MNTDHTPSRTGPEGLASKGPGGLAEPLRSLHAEERAQTQPHHEWPRVSGDLKVGASLSDRYRVLELLAGGGMSRVYLAEQVGLGRKVVLKTIARNFLRDARSVASFVQEASVLARVDHPNIISVYGVGETSSRELYIAMEFVPGKPLSKLLADGERLPLARTVSILLQLARALGAVHREGVIHRDLKPDNVLMASQRSGVDTVKIADFGLAKVVTRASHLPATSSPGMVLGTPEYMAPEQISARAVDDRTDVYSLGCIAYEMLTGRPPFQGTQLAVLTQHIHDEPPPLRSACPEAKIPTCFQKFIDDALAKSPDKRYSSAFKLYAALLDTSDRAGIPRRELRLIESLFDDPAYAIVHERKRGRQTNWPRLERALRWGALGVCLFTAGVAVGRFTGPANTVQSAAGSDDLRAKPPPSNQELCAACCATGAGSDALCSACECGAPK